MPKLNINGVELDVVQGASLVLAISIFFSTFWRFCAIIFVILALFYGVSLIFKNILISENISKVWELLTAFALIVSSIVAIICALKSALNVSHFGIKLIPVDAESVPNMPINKL